MEIQNYKQLFKLSLKNGYLAVFAKVVISCFTLFFLFRAIFTIKLQLVDWQYIYHDLFNLKNLVLILVTVLLIPFNWGLEAYKWKKLVAKIECISFKASYKGILSGLTLGFLTPNRIGEYAGRVLNLNATNRTESIGGVLLGRLCQMVITVVAGCLGLLFFLPYLIEINSIAYFALFFGIVLIVTFVFLILYNSGLIIRFISRIKVFKPFIQYFIIISAYKKQELSAILLISALRYGIFTLQFMLLLLIFGIDLQWFLLIPGISATFLMKSLIPTLNFVSEIGMRELAAMYFFELLGQNSIQVISASLSLWFLNLAIPSAIGLFFILRLKLNKNNA